MKHELKTKSGLAQNSTERKKERYAWGLFAMRPTVVSAFSPALRLCAKTAIVVALGSLLSLVSGCAANSGSLSRLPDGRLGFVIREKADMDEGARGEFERAVAMMNDGKNDAAIELLKRVIDRSPGVSAPYIDIALAYQRTGNPGLAEQHLKTALEMVPGHPVASNEYGLLLRKAGRFKEARVVYMKAINGFPDYLPVRRNLGILCDLYLNDPVCALKQFELYSERMPADEKVKMWVAELRIRLGRHNK